MKKIKDLTTEDFPGFDLDQDQFKNWQQAKIDAEKNVMIFSLISLMILIIAIATTGTAVAPGALVVLLVMLGIRSKSNKMAKSMGLDDRKILQARKGRFKAK